MSEINLQDRVAELELQLEEANSKNAALQASLDSVNKSNSDFAVENEKLKSELAAAKKEATDNLELANVVEKKRAELEAEVISLQDKNSKFENPTFTLGEVEYEILAKNARVPGVGIVSAADIIASPELQAALVEKQSGIIRKKA